jgi:hypothetical protein
MGTFRSRAARLTLVAGLAIGALGAAASPAAAAVSIGQSRPVVVMCNYRSHIMSLTASASPAPGFATQTVWYQYFVYDLTAQAYVPNLNPSTFGTIAAWSSATNAYGMKVINLGTTDSAVSSYNLQGGHRYVVRVDYWWSIGGACYGRTATWTYGAQVYGYAWEAGNGTSTTDACYV